MSFSWPWIFLLLPLPLLAYFLLPAKKQQASALYMPSLSERHIQQHIHNTPNASRLNLILMSLLWLCLITAAAKPLFLGDAVELPSSGRDLLLAVDISRSMEARDMAYQGRYIQRLQSVKLVLDDFLKKRQGDRVGLILYGSGAYIQAPLTFDLKTVQKLLQEAQLGFAGDGTAIGDAIGLGIKRLASNPAENRILVLLTDGANSAGAIEPLDAAKVALKEHVKIYTVGIGHPRSRGHRIDELTLQKIAATTDGEYFRARNQTELNKIYDTIDKLETLEQEPEVFRPEQSLFYWPLSLALGLMLVIILNQRFNLANITSNILKSEKVGGQSNG